MITTYEQAIRLKKLGFDLPTMCFYPPHSRSAIVDGIEGTCKAPDIYAAPSISDALQWLRDEKGIKYSVTIQYNVDNTFMNGYTGSFAGLDPFNPTLIELEETLDTYSGAESALLDAILNYLEERR